MAMTLVSTVTVGSGGAASIEFTNIPQTGKDLLLVYSTRQTGAAIAGSFVFRFNDDSGSNYNSRHLQGTGSAASSSSSTGDNGFYAAMPGTNTTANTFSNAAIYISNYTSTSAKSISQEIVVENNATEARQWLWAQNWTGTSAITKIASAFGDFVQHSSFSLYIIS